MYVRDILQEDTRGVLGRLRYHLSSSIKISMKITSFIVIVFVILVANI